MNLATVGTRGTDVITAGLKLSRRFDRAELIEAYGQLRRARNDALPKWWRQGISNELHRLSSDFSQFHKEGRHLDLIARLRRGEYCFRDEVRPKLIEAANQRADLLITENTLVVPIAGDVSISSMNHLVGAYAQKKIMMVMADRGYKILADTSLGQAYDFTFCGRNRFDSPQIMECKGTRQADIACALTPNEIQVIARNLHNFWLGVVYRIDIVDGTPSSGDVCITPPPILDKWQFTSSFRLRRIPNAAPDLFPGVQP